MTEAPPRDVLGLLTAQALAFGLSLALLIVPANSLFLDAYGSEWLPVTYIATAIAGVAVAGLIARAARATRLVRLATASLGGLAALFVASWALLEAGADWVSGVLLVTFPIALQIGFVFIGGQAARLLDVLQMKSYFPRIVSGFALGFLLGGLLGVPLLALLGSTEALLLATAAAQLAFLGALLLTERRHPEVRRPGAAAGPRVARPSLRSLVTGLVALLLAYQLLSAAVAQTVGFLFFDRAAAQHSGEDLTRYLSGFTAVLNLVDMLFLALLVGPLTRRYGLRLGLTLNPAIVAGLLAIMAVVAAGPGVGSFAVFALAGVLRVADVTATDGTSRTSVNVAYKLVDEKERLAVQAVVEGIGMPVAIGATGVLLLLVDVAGLGVEGVIALGLVVAATWLAVALRVHRAYARSLAGAMRGRERVTALGGEEAAMHTLLRSDDARDVRLGLDLLAGEVSAAPLAELRRLAEGGDPELRLRALAGLAAGGDAHAAAEASAVARELALSGDVAGRRAAAAVLNGEDRRLLGTLLADAEPGVRLAALDAVGPGDGVHAEVVRRVVAAVEEPRTAGAAAAAVARLGEPAVRLVAAALDCEEPGRRLPLVRAAATAAAAHGGAIVAPALGDPDRSVVLAALEALGGAGGRRAADPALLDRVLADALALARDAGAARLALGGTDDALARALDDEAELARRLVIAVLALRHGERVRAAVRVIDHAEGERRALAIEALDVVALPRRGRGGAPARPPRSARPYGAAALARGLARRPRPRPGQPLALAVARGVCRARALTPAPPSRHAPGPGLVQQLAAQVVAAPARAAEHDHRAPGRRGAPAGHARVVRIERRHRQPLLRVEVEHPAPRAVELCALAGHHAGGEVRLAVGAVGQRQPAPGLRVEDAAVGIRAAPVADLAAVPAAQDRQDEPAVVREPDAAPAADHAGVG